MSYNATGNSASRRIATLLDEGSFVEIGGAVTARSTDFNMQEKAAPSDGVITGYGVIDGNLVYVYSQDADVLGGAIGEMHAKKIARIYDMAMKMGAPVIGLIDCTIDPMENEENVHWFLKKYPQFSLNSIREKLCPQLAESVEEEGCIQLLPGIHCSDGFFIARLKKNGEN